jgi:biotin transport system substrate-specific component
LLAFPLAGWVQSHLIRNLSLLNLLFAGLAGIVVYYFIGLPYMYLILNYYLGHTVNIMQILKIGFIPFIIFDVIKLAAAIWLSGEVGRRLNLKREF